MHSLTVLAAIVAGYPSLAILALAVTQQVITLAVIAIAVSLAAGTASLLLAGQHPHVLVAITTFLSSVMALAIMFLTPFITHIH